ncbi:6482_t:CDS:2 [Acaulospora morrowiae]|uniref:6482_t:CDS:1 n=1 Tax=Acaulospora morrowiae TaxID=94023 RepID=A0A9N8VZY2_9GLOM|nr:6482_t:CDS:2 [Acaulospora morrowiae]
MTKSNRNRVSNKRDKFRPHDKYGKKLKKEKPQNGLYHYKLSRLHENEGIKEKELLNTCKNELSTTKTFQYYSKEKKEDVPDIIKGQISTLEDSQMAEFSDIINEITEVLNQYIDGKEMNGSQLYSERYDNTSSKDQKLSSNTFYLPYIMTPITNFNIPFHNLKCPVPPPIQQLTPYYEQPPIQHSIPYYEHPQIQQFISYNEQSLIQHTESLMGPPIQQLSPYFEQPLIQHSLPYYEQPQIQQSISYDKQPLIQHTELHVKPPIQQLPPYYEQPLMQHSIPYYEQHQIQQFISYDEQPLIQQLTPCYEQSQIQHIIPYYVL